MIKECMSGYFQFSSKEDGLYITVYPPKSGYGAASIDDVMFYVDNKNISCDSVKLMEAVKAVFRSWDNPRANVYRRDNDIPFSWGTAFNVQMMALGNK